MPTIKDVAKRANVSISTASYALNGKSNITEETRKRVFDAAKELNYSPNASARNLKRKNTGNIGVFVYGFSGPIFSDILEGIHNQLILDDHNIVVSSGKSSINFLNEELVDAAIVFDAEIDDETIVNFAKKGHPVIVLDRVVSGKNVYSSKIDNEMLVYKFIKKMIQSGYHDFGFLSGPEQSYNNKARYEGFKKALIELDIKTHKYYIGDFTILGGYKAGKKILKNEIIPRFIYCSNDESAIGLIKAFNENNIKMPDSVAIAGFDDIYLDEYITPKLTTIGVNHYLWGTQVAKAITELIRKKNIDEIPQPKGEFRFRESC